MNKTIIHFVRHGSVYNPKEIFYGRLPRYGLSPAGFYQAQVAAFFFKGKPIQAIFSSPLLRARQTARVIAQYLGHNRVITSANLTEVCTPFEGTPSRELTARNWDIYTGFGPPYQQPVDVYNRAHRFIRATLRAYQGQQMVAVTHADVIVFLTLWAKGYPVDFEHKSLIEHGKIPVEFPSPASVTSLAWEDGSEMPEFAYSALLE